MVTGSRNAARTDQVAAALLDPGPELDLPEQPSLSSTDRERVGRIAGIAATAHLQGDGAALAALSSETSFFRRPALRTPQIILAANFVTLGPVQICGNHRTAFAKVETRFGSDDVVGGDPVIVVLVQENARWYVHTASLNVFSQRGWARFAACDFELDGGHSPARKQPAETVPIPILLEPADGEPFDPDVGLVWRLAESQTRPMLEVCELEG